jgi:hypothetical protein
MTLDSGLVELGAAGADIFADGDVYCVAENPQGPISNRGFDFVVNRVTRAFVGAPEGGEARLWRSPRNCRRPRRPPHAWLRGARRA